MSIRLVIVLTSLALVTACGSSTGGGAADPATTSDTTTTGTTPTGTTTDARPPTDGGTFPVTLSRTGGIAGFDDRIVVGSGGSTIVTSKRGAAGSCTLSSDTLTRLLAAVGVLKAVAATTTGPRIADEMFTTLEAPTTRGALRLNDAAGGDLAVVGEIIADVTGASPAYRLCEKA